MVFLLIGFKTLYTADFVDEKVFSLSRLIYKIHETSSLYLLIVVYRQQMKSNKTKLFFVFLFSCQTAASAHHDYHEGGSQGPRSAHCSSEPRLTDNDASPGLRRRGSRRGQSAYHPHQRKAVNAYLDVPDVNVPPVQTDELLDEDLYRLRSFSLTSKGMKLLFFFLIFNLKIN